MKGRGKEGRQQVYQCSRSLLLRRQVHSGVTCVGVGFNYEGKCVAVVL